MIRVNFSDLEIKLLNKAHDISVFDCEQQDINKFLMDDSYNQMEHNMNVTHVFLYNSVIVAYFTLCADSIKIKQLKVEHKEELNQLGIDYEYLPALKLCRLGVDKNFKGNHIGPYILEIVIQNAMNLSKKIGLRYISVDAYFTAKWLYDKYNFKLFPKEDNKISRYEANPHPNQSIAMYRDIKKKY